MQQRPNIVFIFTDQWRGDCLGVAGHPVLETPNLDELARRGAVFTSAFSPCPSCIAARASLFTGLSPSTHGRLGYRDRVPWRYDHTLAEVLATSGYETICVGKTHFFPQGERLGFKTLESYEAQQRLTPGYVNHYHQWLAEQTGGRIGEHDHGLQSNSWLARPSHLPEELHNNTWVATRSIDLLRRRDRTRPFFLFMSFHRPHPPLDPPAVYWDMYRDREVPPVPVGAWASGNDVPADGVSACRGRLPGGVLARSRRAYWAQMAHIDNQIGRLINALRRELQPGPTWFVFSSDHGEMLGDHHLFRKCHAYEGSARIPLVICPPGAEFSETAGRPVGDFLRTAPVTLTDLYPTILEMAGLGIPGRTEGRSLLPLLPGDAPVAGREYVHGEHSGLFLPEMDMQYLTDGRWKYIWFPVTGREQLFELSSDPDELRDLAADPTCREPLELWRSRLVAQLAPRGEDGLSDGGRLIPGGRLPTVRPALLGDG